MEKVDKEKINVSPGWHQEGAGPHKNVEDGHH